jgi:hypothetical protein
MPIGLSRILQDNRLTDGGQVVKPYAPIALNPRKIFWYSFLLEAEQKPGPWWGLKDYVNLKEKSMTSELEHATFRFVA